jgi:hypothetical protein
LSAIPDSPKLQRSISKGTLTLACLKLLRHRPSRRFRIAFSWGSNVKLTFAISVVALVLIAGTTTICMSGAVTDRTTEYGSVHATIEQYFNPHLKAFR